MRVKSLGGGRGSGKFYLSSCMFPAGFWFPHLSLPLTGSSTFPRKFCQIQWLENTACADLIVLKSTLMGKQACQKIYQ